MNDCGEVSNGLIRYFFSLSPFHEKVIVTFYNFRSSFFNTCDKKIILRYNISLFFCEKSCDENQVNFLIISSTFAQIQEINLWIGNFLSFSYKKL